MDTQADVGALGRLGPSDVLEALRAPSTGQVFDLDPGRFPGMPQVAAHPQFSITTFRTPQGIRQQGDLPLLAENNTVDFNFASELLVTGMHIGSHIDALCHAGCGDHWYGGFSPSSEFGDFGARRYDAAAIPPIIVRGVLLDVAGAHGVRHLPPGEGIGADALETVAARRHAPIPARAAVFVRTGAMSRWPDPEAFDEICGAGITLDAARWLTDEREAVLVGSDTPTVEQIPSQEPGHPHPVHDFLLSQRGVHLVENLFLEELASDGVQDFTLLCLPLKITGATGSMVRPVAVT